MTKSWMWQSGAGGVQGAIMDLEDGVVRWMNEPGCACSGSEAEQSLSDFIEKGPRHIMPPQDVLAEMQSVAQGHLQTAG
jgi:hypothetical protein